MTGDIRVRPEEPGDRAAIRAIEQSAFGQAAEADLVDRLRGDGDLILSLVAVTDRPVGHVAFSRLTLDGTALRAAALAPVAVVPEYQRKGVGTALIRDGLARLAQAGEHLVLVLGEPAYYGRFGFTAEAARGLTTPYDGPYLQALALSDEGRSARGAVAYARAFSELG